MSYVPKAPGGLRVARPERHPVLPVPVLPSTARLMPVPALPAPPALPPRAHPRPGPTDAEATGRDEVESAVRHLTVVRGPTSHDVVVDAAMEVGGVLAGVLGDVPPSVRWLARTITGRVLSDGDSLEQAGLVDGAVIVAVAADDDVDLTAPRAGPVSRGLRDRAARAGSTHRHTRRAGPGEDRDRRGRPGAQPIDGLAARVAGCCGVALALVAVTVAGLPRVGVPAGGSAVLALALAAAMSRMVPDAVLRWPVGAGAPEPASSDGSPYDTASVEAWVRLVARRQLAAHLALLVVAVVAAGVLLAASTGMPVAAVGHGLATGLEPHPPLGMPGPPGPVTGVAPLPVPLLLSLVASASVLAGSARGRGRSDRWLLLAAASAALVPMLFMAASSTSTPVAVIAASGCVALGTMAVRPARRRRRPGLVRPRLARVVEVLGVLAVLPLACWACGLLGEVQTWAQRMLA